MSKEADLQKEVVKALKQLGLFHLRINSGIVKVRGGFMHLAREGTADFIIFKGESPYWLELKGFGQTTHKKRAEAQADFRDEVLSLGHRYAKCDSLAQVIEFLEGK